MTAQVSDQVLFGGETYSLAAYSAGAPFDPLQCGFRPVPASTACWRGYVCQFAIRDERLFLDELRINHVSDDPPPPALNGVVAVTSDRSHHGAWLYRDIALPIAYDGKLVIGRDFIRELYEHMGFPPAWKFRHAVEFVFEGGVLVRTTNLDEHLAAMRAEASARQARDKPADTNAVAAWIAKTFDRNNWK